MAFVVIADDPTITPEFENTIQQIKASKYYNNNCIISAISSEHVKFCRNNRLRSNHRSSLLVEFDDIYKFLITKYLQGMATAVIVFPNGKLEPGRLDTIIGSWVTLPGLLTMDLPGDGLYISDINSAIKEYFGESKTT